MSLKRTVFVLGAGASRPYGFPTGYDLPDAIYAFLKGLEFLPDGTPVGANENTIKIAREAVALSTSDSSGLDKYDLEDLDSFLEMLAEFPNIQIDDFLRDCTGTDLVMAKAALAATFLHFERQSVPLMRMGTRSPRDWYRLLFRVLSNLDARFVERGVSIITYNYERSLEQFLSRAAPGKARRPHNIHLHGQLGYHPDYPSDRRDDDVPFAATPSTKNVRMAAAGIKCVHDAGVAGDQDLDFSEARAALRNAELVVFLGFGYDTINVDRLLLDQLDNSAVVCGTKMGAKSKEFDHFFSKLPKGGDFTNDDCRAFFERIVAQHLDI